MYMQVRFSIGVAQVLTAMYIRHIKPHRHTPYRLFLGAHCECPRFPPTRAAAPAPPPPEVGIDAGVCVCVWTLSRDSCPKGEERSKVGMRTKMSDAYEIVRASHSAYYAQARNQITTGYWRALCAARPPATAGESSYA
jgi:hypothetical protein